MRTYLEKVAQGGSLTCNEAMLAMELICKTQPCQEQLAAFLAILHTRGETQEEILGFITYLRKQMHLINCGNKVVIDTCGTGGDHSNTFNISTASALLLASKGASVAKHGGRSVSSRCGSADVVKALGIPIVVNRESAKLMLDRMGFTFLLVSDFNPAFQHIKPLRQRLGIRTCFNVMGPLLNPTNVKRQIIGVYSKHLLRILPNVLHHLGHEEAMVVHSQDGLDEFSIGAPTDVAHLKSGSVSYYSVNAEKLGLTPAPIEAIKGADAMTNAAMIENIFSGEMGACRDSVLLNSAAGFVIAGFCKTFKEGIKLGKHAIDTGQAKAFLNRLRHYSGGQLRE